MADVGTATGTVLRAASRTHPGRVRLNNEDLPLIDAAKGVFGVIDGIGGQAGGEVAAATAKDVILQRLARPVGAPADRVREAIAIANNEIFRRAADSAELAGMACVVTLAIVAEGRLTIGHVGDTRLYKLGPDEMRKLTRDHSPVGEREDAGELSEAEAMAHPRRHEVFRDVGSTFRDKDEQEFVDVVQEPIEPDAAILLCSDGLTDMLSGSAIARIARRHAGDPERVVEALVAAANDAGGRDNVTVVYAEMPSFAERVRGNASEPMVPPEPTDGTNHRVSDGPVAGTSARAGPVRRVVHALVESRTTWFAAGALAGVIGALALTAYVSTTQVRGARTLVVAPDGLSSFTGIMAAVEAARPGDVVRVEPGVYREQVDIRDGIDLVARVPGTVTITGPNASTGPALSIAGDLNVRVAGIRIESGATTEVGIRITAPTATLDLVEITGEMRHALALSPASSVTMRGGRVATTGAVMNVPDDGHATFVNCVFMRTAASNEAALSVSPSAHLVLRGSVFAGFGPDVIEGVAPARRTEWLAGNIVVAAERGAGGAPAAGVTAGPGGNPPRATSTPRGASPRTRAAGTQR